ncbi:MAG: 2-oxoacid:acceptor oxidoreductase family protein, partial [Candidatus Kariarchaeaceae archaeon]
MDSTAVMGNDITKGIPRFGLRIGGAAGDGLQSTGLLIQKYLNRLGYYTLGHPGTQSTIRGGHVWHHVEFSSTEITSFNRKLDLVVALNTQSMEIHLGDIHDGGFLLINSEIVKIEGFKEELIRRNIGIISLPLTSIARDIEIKSSVLANTIAIGALIALLKLPKYPYYLTLEKRFKSKPAILKFNELALVAGFTYYCDHYQHFIDLEEPTLDPMGRFVVSGNEMIALGAVSSGLKFLAQYPITPASSILTYLSKRAEKYG